MQVSPCKSDRWVLRFFFPHSQLYCLDLHRYVLSCLGLLLQAPNTLCALYRSIAQDSDSAQRPEILNTGYYTNLTLSHQSPLLNLAPVHFSGLFAEQQVLLRGVTGLITGPPREKAICNTSDALTETCSLSPFPVM